MSDERLQKLARELSQDTSQLFVLTLNQMRHGFVSLASLVTAIIHLEREAKRLAAEELRKHPTYCIRTPKYEKMAFGQIQVNFKPWGGHPGSSKWMALPEPSSNFHLSPCPHCRCPIWSGDCNYCGWAQGGLGPTGSGREGRYESPWAEERYLAEVTRQGYLKKARPENFYQFYTMVRFSQAVPEYKMIAELIRDTMLDLDVYRWPSFIEVREAYGLGATGVCRYEGCNAPTSCSTRIRNALPSGETSQLPATAAFCWKHDR